MKRVIGVAQILVVLALVVVAALYAWRPDGASDAAETLRMPPESMRTSQQTVSVIRPKPIAATVEINATGSITYRTAVAVVPQVGGRVVWVSPSFRNGGEFKSDETLFMLDPIDAELGVRQAKADLSVALAEMHLTEAERDAATRNYKLLNPDSEVPSLVAKEPQLERSKAAIDRAKARLLAAELVLSRTEFSFPFQGRVLESDVAVGQLLGITQPVGRVYDIKELEAVILVASTDLAALMPVVGRSVLVQSNDTVVEAVIERQSAALDARTRTSTLYAKVESEEHKLVPGNFIRTKVFGRRVDRGFVLPETAEQARSTVWIVKDGLLKRQSIQIHDRREDGLLVEAFEYFDGIVDISMPNEDEGDAVRVANTKRS